MVLYILKYAAHIQPKVLIEKFFGCGELNPIDFSSSFIIIRVIRACPVAPGDGTGVICEICGLKVK